jgi:hypothetical protein
MGAKNRSKGDEEKKKRHPTPGNGAGFSGRAVYDVIPAVIWLPDS